MTTYDPTTRYETFQKPFGHNITGMLLRDIDPIAHRFHLTGEEWIYPDHTPLCGVKILSKETIGDRSTFGTETRWFAMQDPKDDSIEHSIIQTIWFDKYLPIRTITYSGVVSGNGMKYEKGIMGSADEMIEKIWQSAIN